MTAIRFRPLAPTGAALLLAGAANADLWTVDPSGGGDFLDLPAAVAAAADGDVLLLAPGSFTGTTIDDEALALVGSGSATIEGGLAVRNVSHGKTLLLSGLRIRGPEPVPGGAAGDALTLEDNLGAIRVQECELFGGGAVQADPPCGAEFAAGGHGARIVSSLDVTLVRTTFAGAAGDGQADPIGCGFYVGQPGGTGVWIEASAVTLFDTVATGGDGGEGDGSSGDAGSGVHLESGYAYLAGVTASGADGAHAEDFICPTAPGAGGDGIRLVGGIAYVLDAELSGGEAGLSPVCGDVAPEGQPLAVSAEALAVPVSGASRSFAAPAQAVSGQPAELSFAGAPGELVFVAFSLDTGRLFVTPEIGLLYAALPEFPIFDALDANGSLDLSVTTPQLPASLEATTFVLQGGFADPQRGTARLAAPTVAAWVAER